MADSLLRMGLLKLTLSKRRDVKIPKNQQALGGPLVRSRKKGFMLYIPITQMTFSLMQYYQYI